jgi:mannose-6-phosphate isomerase-like protein (cupin superfamily)
VDGLRGHAAFIKPQRGAASMAPMDVRGAKRTEKPWGYELLWALTDRYAGKILHVRAGQRLSRQLHRAKDEYQYVLSGEVVLEIGEGTGMRRVHLGAGEGMHIPTGMVHRLCAVSDADVLEASTPELEDVVRIEDDYGRNEAVAVLAAGS